MESIFQLLSLTDTMQERENTTTMKKTALAEDYVETKGPKPHLGQFSELFLPVGTRQQYGFVGMSLTFGFMCEHRTEAQSPQYNREWVETESVRSFERGVKDTSIYMILKPLFDTDTTHIAAKTSFPTMVKQVKKSNTSLIHPVCSFFFSE